MSKRKPKLERCVVCGSHPQIQKAYVGVWSEVRIRPVGVRCLRNCVETHDDPAGKQWNQLMRWAKVGLALKEYRRGVTR